MADALRHVPPSIAPRVSPMHRVHAGVLRSRLHTLGMPDAVFEACTTVGEVQARAKPYYRATLQVCHPDHAKSQPHGTNAARTRDIHRTWRWLQALDGTARIQWKPDLPVMMQEREYPDVGEGWHVEYL